MWDNLFSDTNQLDKERFDKVIQALSEDKLWADIPETTREELLNTLKRETAVGLIQRYVYDAIPQSKLSMTNPFVVHEDEEEAPVKKPVRRRTKKATEQE